jgi:hypothetical protein
MVDVAFYHLIGIVVGGKRHLCVLVLLYVLGVKRDVEVVVVVPVVGVAHLVVVANANV